MCPIVTRSYVAVIYCTHFVVFLRLCNVFHAHAINLGAFSKNVDF